MAFDNPAEWSAPLPEHKKKNFVCPHLFTARNVLVPVIINIILLIWIWSARPKT